MDYKKKYLKYKKKYEKNQNIIGGSGVNKILVSDIRNTPIEQYNNNPNVRQSVGVLWEQLRNLASNTIGDNVFSKLSIDEQMIALGRALDFIINNQDTLVSENIKKNKKDLKSVHTKFIVISNKKDNSVHIVLVMDDITLNQNVLLMMNNWASELSTLMTTVELGKLTGHVDNLERLMDIASPSVFSHIHIETKRVFDNLSTSNTVNTVDGNATPIPRMKKIFKNNGVKILKNRIKALVSTSEELTENIVKSLYKVVTTYEKNFEGDTLGKALFTVLEEILAEEEKKKLTVKVDTQEEREIDNLIAEIINLKNMLDPQKDLAASANAMIARVDATIPGLDTKLTRRPPAEVGAAGVGAAGMEAAGVGAARVGAVEDGTGTLFSPLPPGAPSPDPSSTPQAELQKVESKKGDRRSS